MIKFYEGLGFTLRRRDMEKGEFVNHLLGTDSMALETAKMILNDESIPYKNRFQLELMEVKNQTIDSDDNTNLVKEFDFIARGIGHVDNAFTVDDISQVLKYIVENGGALVNKPLKSTGGFPAIHCYATDPEGNVLHLAQNLK